MLRPLLVAVAVATTMALALPHVVVAQQTQNAQESLRIAIPGDDGSLTPYTFETGYALMSLVYDTLTWRDASGRPRPWLARSINRDATGLVVTVRLRPGIKWHDGEPLTGSDVAFTYRYMRDRPHPRFTPELQDIARVTTTDDPLVVRFHLRRRSLGLEDQPFADVPILPAHLWRGLPRNRRAPAGLPVGSGPYRLTRYQRGRGYRFDANEDYFREAPSVPRIDVSIIGREDTLADELLRRRIDLAPITIPPGTRLSRSAGLRVGNKISYTGTMLLFNVAGRPFNRLAARSAVSEALDLAVIAGRTVRSGESVVPALSGMVHPRSPWARTGELHRFDLAAARLAFAEQGVDAFRVAAARNDPVRLETGKRVVRALRNAGARAALVELSPAALDRALGRRGAPASFDVAVLGIPALVSYDPSFLRAIFGDPSNAPLNDGGYRSVGFDAAAERVASAKTVTERRMAVSQQLRLLERELPAVPLHFGGGTFVYRPAAYERWVDVRGTGVLDKLSFLRGQAAQPAGTADSFDPRDVTDESDNEGFSLIPVIIGFLVLALAGGLLWLRPRRR